MFIDRVSDNAYKMLIKSHVLGEIRKDIYDSLNNSINMIIDKGYKLDFWSDAFLSFTNTALLSVR